MYETAQGTYGLNIMAQKKPGDGKQYYRSAKSGRFIAPKSSKSPGSSTLTIRPNSKAAGVSFADGVKIIGRRDKAGLTKLADK